MNTPFPLHYSMECSGQVSKGAFYTYYVRNGTEAKWRSKIATDKERDHALKKIQEMSSKLITKRAKEIYPTIKNFDGHIQLVEKFGTPLRIGFISPGTGIMASTSTKAEFWRVQLGGTELKEFSKMILKEVLSRKEKFAPGLVFLFKFNPVDSNPELDYENIYGMMAFEGKKMLWSESDGWTTSPKGNGKQLVAEISLFRDSSKGTKKSGKVKFMSDFGQMVPPQNEHLIDTMTHEDVCRWLTANKFACDAIQNRSWGGQRLDGVRLRKMFGPERKFTSEQKKSLAVFYKLQYSELSRFLEGVSILCRRSEIESISESNGTPPNQVEITFLPYVKPISKRCGVDVELDTEIRATAACFLRKLNKKMKRGHTTQSTVE